jgi:Protein of unknown function (DUF1329)
MKLRTKLLFAVVAATSSASLLAAVSADEAKQLGSTLTPFGAEKAGNKEGTIPEYTGQAAKVPASYDTKKPGNRPDPYNEKPLFSITAQNYTQYADKLDGSAEMFKRFPNYRMDVYPTHRNFVYPKFVLDNSIKNATACKGNANELRLEGCYGGVPFPIPKTGNQAMWNHLTQYEGGTFWGIVDNYIMPTSGPAVRQVLTDLTQTTSIYHDPRRTTPLPSDIIFWKVRTIDIAPPRQAGGSTVLLDPLDWTSGGRRAYQYIPGQRRVKLAPDLAYDTPSPYSGGGQTMDDQKGFLGALDRYDFKLIGKKEKYIPYNNYALWNSSICSIDKAFNTTKGFANPDCVRWELHRVWHVEATLKPGFRHVYKVRHFFWDEDAPGGGVAENYDAAGKLYRVINALSMPFYESAGAGGVAGTGFLTSDLTSGVAGSGGTSMCTDKGCGLSPIPSKPETFFSPDAMAGEGVR